MKNNRTCILCGKQYSYCGNCADDAHKERWYNIYHDNNCRVIFNTVADYCAGEISKEKAIAVLANCDLTDKEHFNKNVLKTLNELYAVTGQETISDLTSDKVTSNNETVKKNQSHYKKK